MSPQVSETLKLCGLTLTAGPPPRRVPVRQADGSIVRVVVQ